MESRARPLLPILPFFLTFQLAHACLIALSPQHVKRLLGSLALAVLVVLAYRCTTGDVQHDYYMGNSLMTQALPVILLNWLTNPIHDFRHERDPSAPVALSFPRRVWWALCVLNSPRGVGWSYEVANIPERPSEPRWSFVRKKLLSALRWFLLLDIAKWYQRANPLFSRREMDLWAQGYLMLPINIIARFSSLVGNIALQYSLLAATFVALGISPPADWPNVYGCWSDSYTVRRFWGRTYHQLLRRLTSGFGKAACNTLGLQPGTWQSRYTQLYVGFAVSGLIHCGGELMVDPSLFGVSFPFYFYQAVAITFEDAVIELVRRSDVKVSQPLARLVGYTWAMLWLCISAPWLITWMLRIGVIDSDRMSVSVIDRLAPHLGVVAVRATTVIPTRLKGYR